MQLSNLEGNRPQLTDANREESRQKTGKKVVKKNRKGGQKRATSRAELSSKKFLIQSQSQHSRLPTALQKCPAD